MVQQQQAQISLQAQVHRQNQAFPSQDGLPHQLEEVQLTSLTHITRPQTSHSLHSGQVAALRLSKMDYSCISTVVTVAQPPEAPRVGSTSPRMEITQRSFPARHTPQQLVGSTPLRQAANTALCLLDLQTSHLDSQSVFTHASHQQLEYGNESLISEMVQQITTYG